MTSGPRPAVPSGSGWAEEIYQLNDFVFSGGVVKVMADQDSLAVPPGQITSRRHGPPGQGFARHCGVSPAGAMTWPFFMPTTK